MADGIWYKIQKRLELNLNQAEAGEWKEISKEKDKGGPMNANVQKLWTSAGFTREQIDEVGRNPQTKEMSATGDLVPWCAVYAGDVLKEAGTGYLVKNASAIAYTTQTDRWGGRFIGKRNYKEWRENDVIVMEGPDGGGSGNHIGFLKGVDPKNNRYQMVGGNQSNSITESTYYNLSKVYGVWRNWEVPAEYDKSVIKDLSGYDIGGDTR